MVPGDDWSELTDKHVVLWYFGANGLRYNGVKFYQNIIRRLISNSNTVTLYDMSAWRALFNADAKFTDENPNADLVAHLSDGNVKSAKSSDFFRWIANAQADVAEWMDSIFRRSELYRVSEGYPDSGIRVGDAFVSSFDSESDAIRSIRHLDGSKAYSALQYLEMIYLTSVFQVNTVFLLPNDEIKYYPASIQGDLRNFPKREIDREVVIFSFRYGDKPNHRPYISGQKCVKVLTKGLLFGNEGSTSSPSPSPAVRKGQKRAGAAAGAAVE